MRTLKDYVVYYRVEGYRKTELMEYIVQGLNVDAVKRDAREYLYPNFRVVKVKPLKNVLKENEEHLKRNEEKKVKTQRVEEYMACNI